MTHKKTLFGIAPLASIFLFCILLGGCVTTSGPAKPNPELSAQYLQNGQQLESQGKLPEALEQYKLALTADPQNISANQSMNRLSVHLGKLADERYQLGMKYYGQGKYALARKQFLIALKYKTDHAKASQMLVSRQPEKTPDYILHEVQPGETLAVIAGRYYNDIRKYDIIAKFNGIKDVTKVKPGQTLKVPTIAGTMAPLTAIHQGEQDSEFIVHKVKPGESISRLAQLYYGDYKKFHVIAQFNRMDDATQVNAGDRIKIPKIEGLPFRIPRSKVEVDQETDSKPIKKDNKTDTDSPPSASKSMQLPYPQPPEPAPIEPLELDSLSKTATTDNESILAYRQAGIKLYSEGRYEDAIFELNKSIEALPNDQQSRYYLAKAYFESGKAHFNKKEYDSAKEAFESAVQFDPSCSECQGYIEKSEAGPLLSYREKGIGHYNRNEFEQAITALQQYLQVQPEDKLARGYLSRSYFQRALIDYNKADFLTAKKGFESALKYNRQCEKCPSYISQSLESYKENHFSKGMTHYSKQRLEDAIAEWNMVYSIDPEYKDVGQRLKKARALMERLEKIKRSRQK